MKRPDGFTLLEVMVALAVVAIALGAIIKGVSEQSAQAAYLRDRTLAHLVTMNRVAELQLARDWPQTGASNGTVELAGQEWFWQARVETTPDASVRKVEVTAALARREGAVLDRLIAFLPRPLPRAPEQAAQ